MFTIRWSTESSENCRIHHFRSPGCSVEILFGKFSYLLLDCRCYIKINLIKIEFAELSTRTRSGLDITFFKINTCTFIYLILCLVRFFDGIFYLETLITMDAGTYTFVTLICADPYIPTPIGVRRSFLNFYFYYHLLL